LSDDVLRDTVSSGVPPGRDLTSNKTVKLDRFGHKDSRSLLEASEPFSRSLGIDLDIAALLSLESRGIFGRDLQRLKIVSQLYLLVEELLLRVVAIEVFRFCKLNNVQMDRSTLTDKTDTSVGQDILLVLGPDVLVIDRISGFAVHPSDVALSALELSVKVLDVAHHPGHLDTTLDREFSVGLHLPSGTRTAPWANFTETGTDDNLVEVNHALQMFKLFEDIGILDFRELVLEVGSGSDRNLLVQSLSGVTIGDSEVGSIVEGDGFAQLGDSVDVQTDRSHDLGDASDTVHSTVQVSPDRFDLGDIEQQWVHETENVESHFLRGERSHTELLETFSNKVGCAHETGSSGPTNNSAGNTEVLSPRFRRPTVEQSLERYFRFRVETVVTEDTVVGG
jgi:hypothetical protein